MKESLFNGPIAFVDVETTGGHPGRNRIIDIAIVAARDGELEYEWSTLINPGRSILARRLGSASRVKMVKLFQDTAGKGLDELKVSYDPDVSHQDAA